MIVPGRQEAFVPRGFSESLLNRLSPIIEGVLLEDWGGPRSPLAVHHFREIVIPDLLYCLHVNLHLLENPTFREIFADKFSNQYGYPQAYAGQLARELLSAILASLPEEFRIQQDAHPWSPWEKIFRLFSLGMINPVIAEKTGYTEEYIQLLRKKYLDITRNGGGTPGGTLNNNAEKEFSRFTADFRQRFSNDRFYLQKLEAQQIVEDLGLGTDHLTLLDILVYCSRVEGQLTVQELAKLLTGGRLSPPNVQAAQEFMLLPHDVPLKGYPTRQVEAMLLRLAGGGVLELAGPENWISLTIKSAKLVGRLVAPELVQILLDGQNQPGGNWDQVCRMLTRLNREMLSAVLEEISAFRIKALDRLLCALYPQVNKQLGLKIIKTLASLNSLDGVPLLLECLTHNDSLVRATAYQALGEIGDRSTAFALLKGFHDTVPLVKEKAIEAAGKLGLTGMAANLQQIAADYKETPAVRRMAGKVAGELMNKQRQA